MSEKKIRQRPLLSLTQVLVTLGLIAALVIALDLNRRAQAGRLVNAGEDALRAEIDYEATRQVHLQATATYVHSDAYIESYARNEADMLLEGERRIAPLFVEAQPTPTAIPTATPDPAFNARPWQAWWRLLTDAPQPAR
jgi:cell division protein FtsB